MKRQELKDRLIGLADGINATTHGIHMISNLEDLIDLIREEGLEGEVRESGLKVTLGDLSVTVPTGNTSRGGVQTHGKGGVVPPGSLSETIAPPWMKDGEIGIEPYIPSRYTMSFDTSPDAEPELQFLDVIVQAFARMDSDEMTARVARYLFDRFGGS